MTNEYQYLRLRNNSCKIKYVLTCSEGMLEVSTYSDEQLLRLLRDSNQEAFTEIYERYWDQLFVSAEKILHSRAAAQDAVQEVFVSLWRRHSLVQIESLRSYLFQAVRFQVFNAIRAEKTGNDFFKRLAATTTELMKEDPAIFNELKNLFEKAIANLPDDQRLIFQMNRDEGLTYQQIAAKNNISVKTVEKKISQALKFIRLNTNRGLILSLMVFLLHSIFF